MAEMSASSCSPSASAGSAVRPGKLNSMLSMFEKKAEEAQQQPPAVTRSTSGSLSHPAAAAAASTTTPTAASASSSPSTAAAPKVGASIADRLAAMKNASAGASKTLPLHFAPPQHPPSSSPTSASASSASSSSAGRGSVPSKLQSGALANINAALANGIKLGITPGGMRSASSSVTSKEERGDAAAADGGGSREEKEAASGLRDEAAASVGVGWEAGSEGGGEAPLSHVSRARPKRAVKSKTVKRGQHQFAQFDDAVKAAELVAPVTLVSPAEAGKPVEERKEQPAEQQTAASPRLPAAAPQPLRPTVKETVAAAALTPRAEPSVQQRAHTQQEAAAPVVTARSTKEPVKAGLSSPPVAAAASQSPPAAPLVMPDPVAPIPVIFELRKARVEEAKDRSGKAPEDKKEPPAAPVTVAELIAAAQRDTAEEEKREKARVVHHMPPPVTTAAAHKHPPPAAAHPTASIEASSVSSSSSPTTGAKALPPPAVAAAEVSAGDGDASFSFSYSSPLDCSASSLDDSVSLDPSALSVYDAAADYFNDAATLGFNPSLSPAYTATLRTGATFHRWLPAHSSGSKRLLYLSDDDCWLVLLDGKRKQPVDKVDRRRRMAVSAILDVSKGKQETDAVWSRACCAEVLAGRCLTVTAQRQEAAAGSAAAEEEQELTAMHLEAMTGLQRDEWFEALRWLVATRSRRGQQPAA
jgi:hypothetical protein